MASKFGRSKRLRGKRGFDSLFRRGKALREDGLTLYSLPNGGLQSRLGCAVGRAVSSKAVVRNRLKRWLREIFRRNADRIPTGMDLVVRVRCEPDLWTYEKMESRFLSLCGRLKSPVL